MLVNSTRTGRPTDLRADDVAAYDAVSHDAVGHDAVSHDAVLFDLDGVLTPTAEVHMRAWAALFRPFLATFNGVQPYGDSDYFDYIDGKQRYEGVAALLRSRGIELPWGDPSDTPDAATVCGLGNRKDAAFNQVLRDEGVAPYPGSVAFLERLEASGVRVAVVSSSRNATKVLAAAGLAERFPVVIDGLTAAAEGLASKPDPATYLEAARRLGVTPSRAVVIEDALSGVEAGARGGFGLVIGVDRGAGADALRGAGAHLVVTDLGDLLEVPEATGLDRGLYPVDEWRLVERAPPAPERLGHTETLFALANGYLGLRGNDEDRSAAYEHGTFINGFHETWPIVYPEAAYGFAEVGQTILNLPDVKAVELRVGSEVFDPDSADVDEYERVLDMAAGVLERRLVWRTRDSGRFEVHTRRLVSFDDKHLALLEYAVTALDVDADVTLRAGIVDRQVDGFAHAATAGSAGAATDGADTGSVPGDEPPAFDPRKSEDMRGALLPVRHGVVDDARPGVGAANTRAFLAHATSGSRLGVAVMAEHVVDDGAATVRTTSTPHGVTSTFTFTARAGAPVTLHTWAAYHDAPAASLDEAIAACGATLDAALALGPGEVFARQREWLDVFWRDSDVVIAGRPAEQQAVRWNLFQLAQASARADGRGIAAKGVTGSGYSGHYFWDTEIYVLPYLSHTQPALARAALTFRHAMLPAARRRAAVMAEAGALFPWRTITGEEASAYYPAGTAQYHIDADITYAAAKYAWATADDGFVSAYGAEIAVETARLWLSLGYFGEGHAPTFHINGVTGPDEYSAVVDDNFYTNVMAAFNLDYAADVLDELSRRDPSAHARLINDLAIEGHEPSAWRTAAAAMALPFDESAGVHLQDARFLDREPWDLAATPPEKRPLLLHFHPLVIYRHQVLKQADLVLALYLHARRFTAEQTRADFDFYDPLTTGDSTLSAAVQSIVAAEVGYADLALRYFERMLYVDLADLHANTADGVHIASAGGTWQALVGGFGGMRDDGGVLRFDPRLPTGWSALSFQVRTRGSAVHVHLTPDRATFTLRGGDSATFEVRGRGYRLSGAQPLVIELN